MLSALRVCNQDMQIAVYLARQLAKSVESGLQASVCPAYLYREIDGGRIGVQFSFTEETAACLIGDKRLDTRDVFYTIDMRHREAVGLNNGLPDLTPWWW